MRVFSRSIKSATATLWKYGNMIPRSYYSVGYFPPGGLVPGGSMEEREISPEPFIGTLASGHAFPGVGKILMADTLMLTNAEVEGADLATGSQGNPPIPVLWLGPGNPTGPFIAKPIGGRWVAGAGIVAPPGCGGFVITRASLNLAWTFQEGLAPNYTQRTINTTFTQNGTLNWASPIVYQYAGDTTQATTFTLKCVTTGGTSKLQLTRRLTWYAAQGGAAVYEAAYGIDKAATATQDPLNIDWVVTSPDQYTITYIQNQDAIYPVTNNDKELRIT